MLKLYILCGYPFAGKSTIADALIKKFNLIRVSLNDINRERGIGLELKQEISLEEWQKTFEIYKDRIVFNLKDGKSVISDTVAHTRKARYDLRKLAEENKAESVILYIATPIEVVKSRLLINRTTKIRADVSDTEFDKVVSDFEIPGSDENIIMITPDMTIEVIFRIISI